MTRPRLAVLFWFYKELDVCRGRLSLLRRLNPGTAIYGLYGGPLDRAGEAQARLGDLLDDFYAYPGAQDPHWKWINGDQLIAAWARERGASLAWDTVVVVQWDMLLLGPVREIFSGLQNDEALFSGFRPLSETEAWWGWSRRDQPERRRQLDGFIEQLKLRYGYDGPLFACLFIVVCLPRRFLERYACEPPLDGFLEYKVPTLARVFGVPVKLDHPFTPWWGSEPATRDIPVHCRLLSAAEEETDLDAIMDHLMREDGARAFHPWRRPFDLPRELP
ncbi:MAG: hypothetical protein KY449_03565 [Proteobacteria bacterium]|nr:hypothetical protein [Pseudomonadota bacterium]